VVTDARWYERVDSGGHAMVFQDMSHDDSADDMALSGAQTDQNWGRLLPSARRVWGIESACSCLNSFGALLNLCLSCA
jgi:hypothetical protein